MLLASFYRETTNERQMRTSTPGREVAILLLSTKITSFRIPLRSRALLHQDHRTALKRKAKWSRKSTYSPFATKSTFDDFLTFLLCSPNRDLSLPPLPTSPLRQPPKMAEFDLTQVRNQLWRNYLPFRARNGSSRFVLLVSFPPFLCRPFISG